MGRSGDGVLADTGAGPTKEARYEIDVGPVGGCRQDDADVQALTPQKVTGESGDTGFIRQLNEQLMAPFNGLRLRRQPAQNIVRHLAGLTDRGRKVQLNVIAFQLDRQDTAGAVEAQGIVWPAKLPPQHMGTGKRRVSAQRNLAPRREPADTPVVTFAPDEGGFGQIVLRRQALHGVCVQCCLQWHDGGGVPFEYGIGERVDLVDGVGHVLLLVVWVDRPGHH